MAEISEAVSVSASIPTDPRSRDAGRDGRKQPDHADDDAPPPKPPRNIDDIAVIMGIPNRDMTPEVREALMTIMSEFDRQREDLDRLKSRSAFLMEQADEHSFMPILSRRRLMGALSRVLSRTRQLKTTSGFICLHIRTIEEIRRTYGREAAEGIMRQISLLIADHLGEDELLGSLDGYDFGVILPLMDYQDIRTKGEEIATAIAATRFPWKQEVHKVGAYCGVTVFTDEDTAEAVTAAAEHDLMQHIGM